MPSVKTSTSLDNLKRKIILISCKHGRDLVHFLTERLADISISSIIKPNAVNRDLEQTAINVSAQLSKDDMIILWPEEKCCNLFSHLNNNLRHTIFLILSTPDRYDDPQLNEKIYYSNLALYRKVHTVTGNLICLINVNSVLRRTNYTHMEYYIRQIGKRYIATHIVDRIKNTLWMTNDREENMALKAPKIQIAKNMNDIHAGMSEVNNESLTPNLAEELGQNHFLYPRLSQIMLKDQSTENTEERPVDRNMNSLHTI